ncbi:MAG: DNA pilot protein [Microviridae sp.]|nr:MAG: DNA pilot protein [Microviridae sp.]
MSIFSKIGKALKKVVKKVGKYAAPIAGIGGALLGAPAIGSAIGGLFSAKSGDMSDPNMGPQQPGPSGSAVNWGGIGEVAKASIPLVQGAMNYVGQSQTNAANAQQAQKQMDFQAEQSNTSYQRGMADMKAAGLNPMLAYSQGGASSSSGASAQMGNELGAGANSALSAMQTIMAVQNMEEQNRQIAAQTRNIDMDTTNKGLQAPILTNQGNAGKWDYQIRQEELNKIKLANYTTNRIMEDTVASAKATAEYQTAHAKEKQYSLSKARAYDRYYKNENRLSGGYYEPSRLAIQETINSGTRAVRDLAPWKF